MWKIAIIDDDRQVLKGMKQAIPWGEIGAEWVGESTNGANGLELIRQKKPDIVITDVYMPGMDGLSMIERLREEHYEGKFLIHSGYSDFEFARKALRLNVEDYLSKPVSRKTLHEALQRVILAAEKENKIQLEQQELRDKVILYEPFVHKEWLKTAVIGTMDDSNKEHPMFNSDKFLSHLVLGIEIMRTPRLSKVSAPDRSLFRFAIQNIIQEILNEDKLSFDYVELHGYHVALILHYEQESKYEEFKNEAIQVAQKIIDSVQKYLYINLRIGIGGLKNHWSSISESLEEAFHFLSQETTLMPSSSLFEFCDATGKRFHTESMLAKPMRFYHQIIEDIKNTQGKMAEKIINDYISTLKEYKDSSLPPSFNVLGAQFWMIASYALNDEKIRLWEIFTESQIESELLNIHTADQFEGWLNDKIKGICINQNWHENLKHKQAVDFMKQYIHENYTREITLAELAEKVFISRNYLSLIFKNATGETINHYIIRVRMEKAKALLLKGTLKIYEIAESVGYKNIPYFSTTFKKHFGITPVELIR
ncbi:response regulator transcription factor [Paenibacillus agricola]|uniref:Response regulator transcription factor n=1 Tax=Paenibacillus agricola TaxID=2716264 RepID=A0ABX0JJQ7_9BACL|nr:response regulator [Paenibacillus agricola]NHN34065.1 response regulator transcription factor [Paenibacillus agricola]